MWVRLFAFFLSFINLYFLNSACVTHHRYRKTWTTFGRKTPAAISTHHPESKTEKTVYWQKLSNFGWKIYDDWRDRTQPRSPVLQTTELFVFVCIAKWEKKSGAVEKRAGGGIPKTEKLLRCAYIKGFKKRFFDWFLNSKFHYFICTNHMRHKAT